MYVGQLSLQATDLVGFWRDRLMDTRGGRRARAAAVNMRKRPRETSSSPTTKGGEMQARNRCIAKSTSSKANW